MKPHHAVRCYLSRPCGTCRGFRVARTMCIYTAHTFLLSFLKSRSNERMVLRARARPQKRGTHAADGSVATFIVECSYCSYRRCRFLISDSLVACSKYRGRATSVSPQIELQTPRPSNTMAGSVHLAAAFVLLLALFTEGELICSELSLIYTCMQVHTLQAQKRIVSLSDFVYY